jgi:hypothetical protein
MIAVVEKVLEYDRDVKEIAEDINDAIDEELEYALDEADVYISQTEANIIKVMILKEALKKYGVVIDDEGDKQMLEVLKRNHWRIE